MFWNLGKKWLNWLLNRNMAWEDEITKLRHKLNKVDKNLLELLAIRMELVKEVKVLKEKYHEPVYQKARWDEILVKLEQESQKLKLNSDFVKDIWNRIHIEALDLQKK